jgi:hypothetical protein
MKRCMMCAAIGASLLLSASGSSASARAAMPAESVLRSQAHPLIAGDRVRLTPLGPSGRIVGTVQAASSDSLYFAAESGSRLGSQCASWSSLRMAERSAGKRGHAVRGLFIGLAAGVGIGLLATTGHEHRTGDPWADFGNAVGDAMSEAIAVVLCGVGGLAAGAAIGGELKSDRWERVPLPPSSEPRAEEPAPSGPPQSDE